MMTLLNWFFGVVDQPTPGPTAIAVTFSEGGNWFAFPCRYPPTFPQGVLVHAIAFSNGRIWDAVNGWRPDDDRNRDMFEYIERVL